MANNNDITFQTFNERGERLTSRRVEPDHFEALWRLVERHPGGVTFDMSGPMPRILRDGEIPSSSQLLTVAGRQRPDGQTNFSFARNVTRSTSSPNPGKGVAKNLSNTFVQRIYQDFQSSQSPSEAHERSQSPGSDISQSTTESLDSSMASKGLCEEGDNDEQFLAAKYEFHQEGASQTHPFEMPPPYSEMPKI